MQLTAAALELGALIGALSAGSLANTGRRRSIFIATLIFLLGSLIQTVSPNGSLASLIIGRFMGGIGM